MANKTIQLKDSDGNNLYPELNFYANTWTAHIYDYETKLFEMPGHYYRIGTLYFFWFNEKIDSSYTFSTMLQIRNFPCSMVLMGQMYVAGATNQMAGKTLQIAQNAYIRPNFTGTVSANTWWSGFFIGYKSQ